MQFRWMRCFQSLVKCSMCLQTLLNQMNNEMCDRGKRRMPTQRQCEREREWSALCTHWRRKTWRLRIFSRWTCMHIGLFKIHYDELFHIRVPLNVCLCNMHLCGVYLKSLCHLRLGILVESALENIFALAFALCIVDDGLDCLALAFSE